ncbi:VOC family protein [Intrasporangium mesophilum]
MALLYPPVLTSYPAQSVSPGGPPGYGTCMERNDSIDEAEAVALSLGARRAPGSPETGNRVFLDPAGHPFCLVHGASPVQDSRIGFDTKA